MKKLNRFGKKYSLIISTDAIYLRNIILPLGSMPAGKPGGKPYMPKYGGGTRGVFALYSIPAFYDALKKVRYSEIH